MAMLQMLTVDCSFVETFGLQNRKVYIAGESYAGMVSDVCSGRLCFVSLR